MQALADAVIKGDQASAVSLTKEAIDTGVAPDSILSEGLIAGMEVIGVRFKNNEVYIPQVLIAARAMKSAMEILEPKLVECGIEPVATVIIATVAGDLHDIGKNLVAMMLKGAGFKVVDLGVNCTSEKYIEAAKEHNPELIAMSALLTTTMPAMEGIIKEIRQAGIGAKVMIGGAPVTQVFCDKIGADGYSPDAASAVVLAKNLLS